MPKARKHQVSLEATPYYHCISRCVRRAFLCGEQYEHRRQWVEDRILELAKIFAIDICAFAVMSNHYHVVLHVNQAKANSWSNKDICVQWHQLFKGNSLSQRFVSGEILDIIEQGILNEFIYKWRQRLVDISWFMRLINEPLARMANAEDNCTGRFWEGRFKSQALLDESALASCMTYVDLNPIRAKMADTPEASDHTSIQKRIIARDINSTFQLESLMKFAGNPREPMPEGLPFNLDDYIELVDWSGRVLRENKRGFISNNLPPILERLKMEPKYFLFASQHFESNFKGIVGTYFAMKNLCVHFGYQRIPTVKRCKETFG